MKLLVRNLGPIQGNTEYIDIYKDLYLFIGLNSSGKSLISYLLWTIYNKDVINKFCRGYKKKLFIDEISKRLIIKDDRDEEIYYSNKGNVRIYLDSIQVLLKDFAKFLEEEIYITLNIHKDIILLNTSFEFYIKDLQFLRSHYCYNSLILRSDVVISENIYSNIELYKNDNYLEIKLTKDLDDIRGLVLKALLYTLLNYKDNSILLPSSNEYYKYFYEYIESKNNVKYKRPIEELLYKVRDLREDKEYIEDEIVEKLKEIIGGEIIIKGSNSPQVLFKCNRLEIPLDICSSTVKELSILYLYFKYWIKEINNFLILDQSGYNFYFNNEVKLLELFIRFINNNNGNKLLITTNSNTIKESLNIYIHLNRLKEEGKYNIKRLREINNLKLIDEEIDIDPSRIGIYFFNGKRIINYEDNQYGIYFREYTEKKEYINKWIRELNNILDE